MWGGRGGLHRAYASVHAPEGTGNGEWARQQRIGNEPTQHSSHTGISTQAVM